MEDSHKEETAQALRDLQRILNTHDSGAHKNQFGVYAQFTHDVQGGESLLNKDIARELIKKGLLTPQVGPQSIRFLQKVSKSWPQLTGWSGAVRRERARHARPVPRAQAPVEPLYQALRDGRAPARAQLKGKQPGRRGSFRGLALR